MEQRDINFISPQATPDQVERIMQRCASGHIGTICKIGDARNVVNHGNRNVRFKFIRNFLRALRNFGD